MTKRLDFIVNKGSDFQRVLTFKDSTGAVQLLNGYTARMKVRRTPPSTEIIDNLTTTNGRLSISSDNKSITLSIPHTVVYPLKYTPFGVENRFVYDFELITSGGNVAKVLAGEIVYIEEVSRDNLSN